MICSGVLVIVIAITFCACASQPAADSTTKSPQNQDPIEVACEIALVELEQQIERSQENVGAAALAEVRELYRFAKRLYLEREYELALELIDEALALLEETND